MNERTDARNDTHEMCARLIDLNREHMEDGMGKWHCGLRTCDRTCLSWCMHGCMPTISGRLHLSLHALRADAPRALAMSRFCSRFEVVQPTTENSVLPQELRSLGPVDLRAACQSAVTESSCATPQEGAPSSSVSRKKASRSLRTVGLRPRAAWFLAAFTCIRTSGYVVGRIVRRRAGLAANTNMRLFVRCGSLSGSVGSITSIVTKTRKTPSSPECTTRAASGKWVDRAE